MRYCLALLVLALTACAAPVPQTITITKTVPVYPPASLYDDGPLCQQLKPRSTGTVGDLAVLAAVQHGVIQDCIDDRTALRKWRDGQK